MEPDLAVGTGGMEGHRDAIGKLIKAEGPDDPELWDNLRVQAETVDIQEKRHG